MKYIYTLDTHIQTENEINDYYEESENYRLTTIILFILMIYMPFNVYFQHHFNIFVFVN